MRRRIKRVGFCCDRMFLCVRCVGLGMTFELSINTFKAKEVP